MARSVAKITVDILRDQDWTGLTAAAQRLYALVILPQPKLTLCGYLDSINPARWSNLAADTNLEQIQAALDELEAEEYVVIDHDTEELVVRTFVKNDLDASRLSANVCKGFWAAWKSIASPHLRRTVVENCPAEHWEKLAKHAPADALQTRRSAPFEREHGTPSEWGTQPPCEREAAHPVESTLYSHQSPVDSHQPPVDNAAPTPTEPEPQPVDNPAAAAATTDQERTQRFHAAIEVLVDRHLARNPSIAPGPHRRGVTHGKRTDHASAAMELLEADPELTAHQLADLLEPPPRPSEPTPAEQTVQALMGDIARNAARATGRACTTCSGAYWLDAEVQDDGTWGPAKPCPDCNPEARTTAEGGDR